MPTRTSVGERVGWGWPGPGVRSRGGRSRGVRASAAPSSAGRPRRGRPKAARPVGRACLIGCVLLGASACYTGRTLAPDGVRPGAGSDVVVRLTPAGAVRLAEESGRTDRVLRGRLQGQPRESPVSGSLVLAVASLEAGRAITTERLRQVVVVPLTDVQELQVREFSTVRTALLGVVGVGAAIAVAAAAFGWAGDGGGDPDPPGGVVPLRALWRLAVP